MNPNELIFTDETHSESM